MRRGQFITIEGQDGAGKSTNVAVIKECLNAAGISYVHSREPGGTPLGEALRELLLSSKDNTIGNKAELLLIFAARAQHIQDVIEPALACGQWVLCDRFTDATYAYQSGGRGMPEHEVAELEKHVQGSLRPDLTLLLDIPVELGERRAGQRSEPDRFELQQQAFKQKVRDCYLARAANEPARIKTIDSSCSFSDVKIQVECEMMNFINAHV